MKKPESIFSNVIALFVFAIIFTFAIKANAYEKVVPDSREQITLSFSPVVKKAAPTVVNIYTKKVVTSRGGLPLLFNDPFFRGFFGNRLGAGLPRKRIENSLGSGVLIKSDGVIVTNFHVIKGADAITVVLNDKREFSAKIIGIDEKTDIAVLKIDAEGEKLPYLKIGDSENIEIGDLVLAIGNPFGIGQTVTSGIVSALARTSIGVNDFQFFIQTDASINPGNSGGALITMDGHLVGVNTVIISTGGGSNGIGFATPSNMIDSVVSGILKTGKASRPWFGVSGQNVTHEIASSLGFSKPLGVLINRVYPNSPADKAGLKTGDVIFAINGKELDDVNALDYRIATQPLDTVMFFNVQDKNERKEVAVKLVAPPEIPLRNETSIGRGSPLIGITVANLNPALSEEMGIDMELYGVVLTRVGRDAVVGRFGVRPRDIIQKINRVPITSVKKLLSVLSKESKEWEIILKRGSQIISVMVRE